MPVKSAANDLAPWRARTALGLVLGLGLILRLWALSWGAPYLYHPDEHLVLQPALNIVRNGDPNPHWFQYPSLLIYLQSGVIAALRPFTAAPLTSDPELNHVGPWDILPAQWPFALGGRLLVGLFAITGVWLLYRCGARYEAPAVGLAAALFLVSSPLHNESSHYLTTDVPATTLLTAALWCSIAAARAPSPQPGWLAAAGFCAGLAAATKYTAGIVLLVPLAVALSSSLRTGARRAVTVLAAAAAGFVVACPFLLLDFPAVWNGILQQRQNYLHGYDAGNNWRWYLRYLYGLGLSWPVAIAAALGFAGTAIGAFRAHEWAERRLSAALVLAPVVYFVFVSSYPARAERNLIVILPFACLLAARVCWRALQLVRGDHARRAVCAVAATLMAWPGLVVCVKWNRQLAYPDTRTVALRWIDEHVPAGSRIAREEYTPQLSDGRYQVTYVWSLAWRDYAWYLAQGTDYLVVSSNVYDRALQPPYVSGTRGPQFYRFVFDRLPLAAEFTPGAQQTGPTIRIYQVPHG